MQSYRHSLAKFCEDAYSVSTALKKPLNLGPYSKNYVFTHISALENTYPTVKSKLGSTLFRGLAAAYTKHFSATNTNLNLYGEQFAFLLESQTYGGKKQEHKWREISRIAEIEYSISLCYYLNTEHTQDNEKRDITLDQMTQEEDTYPIEPIPMQLFLPFYRFIAITDPQLDGCSALRFEQKAPYLKIRSDTKTSSTQC